MALKTIEPVPELIKDLNPLDNNNFALLSETAELYAVSQPDRSRKLLNQVIEKLRSLEPQISPDDRKFVLNPRYASITRVYALLGQPERAESFAKRVISSDIPANEISAFEVQAKVRLQVSLTIAYANAKQQAKADRIMTQTLNSTNDAPILIDALLQYAKGGEWIAATQATALIKDPQTRFRARLDLGALADQQGRPDRAIELGKLAAQQAREASSFSIGRDDVIQWLNSWLSSETSTNALLPVMESLELYVYDLSTGQKFESL
jgi:tetratricopeptide (TPR) repeat protein